MKLSRLEQETIINYNEDEKTASVYTHNRSLRRKLDALLDTRPDDIQLVRECHDGQAREYLVPRRWVKVNPPRKPRELSEEQRQIIADRLAKAREAHQA